MREYIHIGETKVCFNDLERNATNIQYKLMTRQKVKNILIDCEYCETKPIKNRNFSFLITIKVFGKNPHKPLHCYEIYANTLNTRYNHIYSRGKSNDYNLETSSELQHFNSVMQFINNRFETFTTEFISIANQVRNGKITITTTPEFILEVIDEIKAQMEEKNTLNKN